MEYGLIGAKLGHSYSKQIHELLCGYRYELRALPTEAEARAFLEKRPFKAINVTIPYKKLVMEYCAYIDPRAAAIGAVNTVVNRSGVLCGYNTDYMGFAALCQAHGVRFAGRTVLVLGTGGTHNTVCAVAQDQGASQVLTVSRRPGPGQLSYAQAAASGAQIVVNTTPAGMYPDVGVCSLDIRSMPGLEAVVDVVYNPSKTELVLRAEEAGVPVAVGGLEMLVSQAVYAAGYFLGKPLEDPERQTARDHRRAAPPDAERGAGGDARRRQKHHWPQPGPAAGPPLCDLDEEVVRAAGCSIPEIFAQKGEAAFREMESAQAARWGKQSGLVDRLRRRRRAAQPERPRPAAERCRAVFGPSPPGAEHRRQTPFHRGRCPGTDGAGAPSPVSGGSGCRHPQHDHRCLCAGSGYGGFG